MSRDHWQQVYATKADNAVSWYESTPEVSLALIRGAGIGTEAAIVDIGGGASRLVDALLAQGQNHIAVLDLAGAALEGRQNAYWRKGLVGTFALNGPQTCSGLPVVRHDSASLSRRFGNAFELMDSQNHDHTTPWGSIQHLQFSRFRRRL